MHETVGSRVVVLVDETGVLGQQGTDTILQPHRDLAGLVVDANLCSHPMADVLIHCAKTFPREPAPRRSHMVQAKPLHFTRERCGIETAAVPETPAMLHEAAPATSHMPYKKQGGLKE